MKKIGLLFVLGLCIAVLPVNAQEEEEKKVSKISVVIIDQDGERVVEDIEVNIIIFGPEVKPTGGAKFEHVCIRNVIDIPPISSIILTQHPA